VHPEHDREFRELLGSLPHRRLGTVGGSGLELGGRSVPIEELYRIYESALPESLR